MILFLVTLIGLSPVLAQPVEYVVQTDIRTSVVDAKSESIRLQKLWAEMMNAKRVDDAKRLILDARESFAALPKGKKAYAALLNDTGDAYDDRHMLVESAYFLKLAADAYGEIGDKKGQGNALNNRAIELGSAGNYGEAASVDMQALQVRKSIKSSEGIHQSLIALSEDYRNWGRFAEAEVMGKEALRFAIQIKDLEKQAVSWIAIGNFNSMTGSFDAALKAYRSAYTTLHHLNLKNKAFEAIAIGNEGAMWEQLGQLHRASDCYRISLRLPGSTIHQKAVNFNNLGTNAFRQSSFPTSIFYFRSALDLHRQTGTPDEVITTLLSLGGAYRTYGRLPEAEQCYRQAQLILDKQSFSISRGDLLANQADLRLSMHDFSGAVNLASKADSLLAVYGRPMDRAECLRTKADALRALGKCSEAIESLRLALDLYEESSSSVTDPAGLAKFLDISQRGLYSDLASMLLEGPRQRKNLDSAKQQERVAEAWTQYDRGRGQGLFRQLGASQKNLETLLSQGDREQFVVATKRLKDANSYLAAQVNSYLPGSNEVQNALMALETARRESRNVDRDLAKRYPQFARVKGLFSLDAKQLIKLAKSQNDTITIEYCCRDNETLVFILGGGSLNAIRIPISAKRIQAEVDAWKDCIVEAGELTAKPRLDKLSAREKFKAREASLSRRIYSQLVGPALEAFGKSNIRRLIVVPDGGLLDAPFAALSMPNGKRLVERFALSYQISIASNFWPRRNAKGNGLIAIAYDALADNASNLPSAYEESLAISKSIRPSLAAKSSEYRISRIKEMLPAFDMIHFATHAKADIDNGLLSKLDLGAERSLDAKDVLALPLKSRLVVLSACSTAVGQPATGEGRLGLVWSFQAAGARSVVATKWDLNDSAARRQMVDFYRLISQGKPLDLALQAAAKNELGHSGRGLPYFWAAYSLVGSQALSRFAAPTH